MNWTKATIYTTTDAIEIVSGYLISFGINGLEIQDSKDFCDFLDDTTIHWDYIEDELMSLKTTPTNIKFYIPDNIQGIETYNAIKSGINELISVNPQIDLGTLVIEVENINEEDWETAWKKYYHPINIGEKIVVCPCWEECELPEGKVKVILDPGMAFGTGTHETTRLCMELLEGCVDENTTMLDIGTGSGILAITALLLGAKSAVGVDIDELAVKISGDNARLNGVEQNLTTICGDLAEKVSGTFDVVCANIVADVIIRLSKDAKKYMHKNSTLLVSGIIDTRCEEVKFALLSEGFTIQKECTENGWVAIKLV
ncbi:MAG: 50S ribosomal protein L11 methyltransferase [Niameybacter sp.]